MAVAPDEDDDDDEAVRLAVEVVLVVVVDESELLFDDSTKSRNNFRFIRRSFRMVVETLLRRLVTPFSFLMLPLSLPSCFLSPSEDVDDDVVVLQQQS